VVAGSLFSCAWVRIRRVSYCPRNAASSILQRRGFTGVVNVSGGMEAWDAAQLPVVSGPRQA
jgi:rhodanese-related sulfurtransferase